MLPEFIVMFRESLEVAFVIGIILAYLHKTKNEDMEKHVWLGVSAGLVLSIVLAYLFQFLSGGFAANEELFEGIFMVLTSAFVSWLIFWVVSHKNIAQELRDQVKVKLDKKEAFGLFALALTATIREGVEAVLFMAGISLNIGSISIFGALLGVIAAIVVGILVFEYAVRFNIGLFFKITTAVLVLLAAGLFSQGLHELQEAKVLPTYVEHVYNINPPVNADGSYPLLHEKGPIGSIFKGLVGYDGNPSDIQIVGYIAYILGAYMIYKKGK
ncbi:FTR1 family protein [Candidatus Micrarchaeota archaeon]|nr:FTR1 family protein [Candidatus Micrarchaeota archaeon]